MDTMTVTSSRVPNKREKEEFRQMMRTLGLGRLTVRIKGEDGKETEAVLELEKKDAEGRTLLQD